MNDQTRTWRQALPGPRALVTIASAGLLVLLAAIVGAVAFDVPINDIVNDPMYTLDGPPLTGAVSDLGVLLWWAGAVIALFGGFLLGHRSGRTQASRFLLVGGLIAAYLTFDDLFMFHEALLNKNTPLPQPGILAITALVVLLYVAYFRAYVRTTEWSLLVIAGILFAASLVIDIGFDLGDFLDVWEPNAIETFVEDSFKWLGIVAWTTYFVRTTAAAIADTRDPPSL